MNRLWRELKPLLWGVPVLYVLVCLLMWAFQRDLMYVPMRGIQAPAVYGLADFQEIGLVSDDKIPVTTWYRPAREGYPTIIHFHGNGGNLSHRAAYFKLLAQAGFGVLALDYRGYGLSGGTPTETGFYADGRAVMAYATGTLGLPLEKIILYGESIGTGVAVQMASEFESAALVLQSPFTSIEVLAQDKYPWLPVRLLLQDRFDSIAKIQDVRMPLLLLHGEQDTIVPVKFGRMLFETAPGPKDAVYFPDHGHNNFDWASLAEAVAGFARQQRLVPDEPPV